MGEIVLLGALLLLAVTETSVGQAGSEVGAGSPLIFWGGGESWEAGEEGLNFCFFDQSVKRSKFILYFLLAQGHKIFGDIWREVSHPAALKWCSSPSTPNPWPLSATTTNENEKYVNEISVGCQKTLPAQGK